MEKNLTLNDEQYKAFKNLFKCLESFESLEDPGIVLSEADAKTLKPIFDHFTKETNNGHI